MPSLAGSSTPMFSAAAAAKSLAPPPRQPTGSRRLWFRFLAAAGVVALAGVAFGHFILGEPLSSAFLGAAALVGAGIVLVNPRTRRVRAP